MNRSARRFLLAWLTGACLWPGAQAQSDEAFQRQRIDRERAQAEASFAQQEYVCSQRFAVTACLEAAKSERRAQLDGLRRQEEVLDANERRRRAGARLEVIRQKTEAEAALRAAHGASSARSTPAATAASATPPSSPVRTTAPPPADTPAPPTPAAAPTSPKAAAADAGRRRAAAASAAAERAEATRNEREKALQAEKARTGPATSTRPSAAPLPPRPAIPPASAPRS